MPETPPRGPDVLELPEAASVPKSRWKFSIIWLIPLVAALIGGWLAVQAILQHGPTITVAFKTAEGLEAGKTKLKYKDVDIGLVTNITLSKDLSNVIATAELVKDFTPHLVEDTRFWIVRPRISGGTVSGISTLLSGSYIGVDVGRSTKEKKQFTGLETPPVIRLDTPGRDYKLHADNIGSLDVGVPVFYRQLPVGQITGYELDPNGKDITVKVFVNEPYSKYVTANTRFWNASGIKVRMDANGIKVDTQSLTSIVIGGIAFDNPPGAVDLNPVAAATDFVLFSDREDAMKNPEKDVLKLVMIFDESVRGLSIGAPVDFRGIPIGEVTAIKVGIDPVTRKVFTPIEVDVYPERLHQLRRDYPTTEERTPQERKKQIDAMVLHGLRAQLRAGNLLTGQLYIAVDFFPNAPKAKMNWEVNPPELPTAKGNLQEIQNALTSIANKLDKFPIEQLGTDLHNTLDAAHVLLRRVDSEIAPELRATVSEARKALNTADRALQPDQGLQQDARETMRELTRAANAFRILADYLDRHPEALIRGKTKDEK